MHPNLSYEQYYSLMRPEEIVRKESETKKKSGKIENNDAPDNSLDSNQEDGLDSSNDLNSYSCP